MHDLLKPQIEAAIAAMTWLKPSDHGAVALALAYAEQIDDALANGSSTDATKALYLGPHLLQTLRALGGAPAERKALGAEEAANGKLAQLRAIHGGAA